MGAMEEPQEIEFERLSEFFFDLCLSWCQHLDIETFLFFLNGIFLNITKGAHVNVSVFKPLEEIDVLSIEFFNTLLNLRAVCSLYNYAVLLFIGYYKSYYAVTFYSALAFT